MLHAALSWQGLQWWLAGLLGRPLASTSPFWGCLQAQHMVDAVMATSDAEAVTAVGGWEHLLRVVSWGIDCSPVRPLVCPNLLQ